MKVIGLMSGTSMDGVEVALLDTDGETQLHSLGHVSLPYDWGLKTRLHLAQYVMRKVSGDLKQAEAYFSQGAVEDFLSQVLKLDKNNLNCTLLQLAQPILATGLPTFSLASITLESAHAHRLGIETLLNTTGFRSDEIDLIGYHGQTLYHDPGRGLGINMADPIYLAKHCGIAVVYDFRAQDLALGGQGAPLAPLYHLALARRDKLTPCAIINCGGIANVTLIPTENENSLCGFDTGPGNGLIDKWVTLKTQGREQMDKDGRYGFNGVVNETVLNALHQDAIPHGFLEKNPPKALDIGDLQFISALDGLSLEDGCRTLEAFTAETIVRGLMAQSLSRPIERFILAGGGWYNPVIYKEFQDRLSHYLGSEVIIQKAEDLGWKNAAIEAEIFAYLAVRNRLGKPISLPQTTQVPYPLCGGRYVPRGTF